MNRKYDWDDTSRVGDLAVECVTEFLSSPAANQHWYPTQLVESVEDNPAFRERDVDLLVVARVDGELRTLSVEVKGDRNAHTGNFFFETVSDISRKTEGAFLTTTAKWYFYIFLEPKVLYLIPMNVARPWFLANFDSYSTRETKSERLGRKWRTAGKLVPIKELLVQVDGAKSFRKIGKDWVRY